MNGNVNCIFQVFFTVGPDGLATDSPITSISAYNLQGSGLTKVSLERNTDGVVQTFPLPTSGQKTTVTTLAAYGNPTGYTLTDGQGNPVSNSFFHATVSQTQINAQGFTFLSDIGTQTVF